MLANGTVDGGILNSASSTGTYIVQSSGDLRLGAITSNGPVFLEAAGADGHAANILNGLSGGRPDGGAEPHIWRRLERARAW